MTEDAGDYLEIEQKYEADANFALPDLSRLGGRTKSTRPRRYYLSATYFDTEELDLIRNRITLRRRVGGTDEGWHLKLPVRKDTRQEVRAPLGRSDTGSIETVPARLAAHVEDITAGHPLHPIAILDTERTVVTLTDQAGEPLAEVADDRVTATRLDRPGGAPMMWREIEVEALTTGSRAQDLLAATGQALRQAGARPSPSASKLGRLLGGG